MSLPRSQGLRQAASKLSALPSSSVKFKKSRLLRITYDNISLPFLNPKQAIHMGNCKYFALRRRLLSRDIISNINKGPSFLAGAYPPGLLHSRHEKYRLINHVNVDTWRTGNESEMDHQRAEEDLTHLSLQRLPILNDDSTKIPTIITTSKKVHKLSFVRHQISKKLWNAFDMAVKKLQGTPSEVGRVSKFLYIIQAKEDTYQAKNEDVTSEMVQMLERHSKQIVGMVDGAEKRHLKQFRSFKDR